MSCNMSYCSVVDFSQYVFRASNNGSYTSGMSFCSQILMRSCFLCICQFLLVCHRWLEWAECQWDALSLLSEPLKEVDFFELTSAALGLEKKLLGFSLMTIVLLIFIQLTLLLSISKSTWPEWQQRFEVMEVRDVKLTHFVVWFLVLSFFGDCCPFTTRVDFHVLWSSFNCWMHSHSSSCGIFA